MLQSLLNRVRALDESLQNGSAVRDALSGRGDDILELQKQQLFAGLRPDGEDIRPYYSEDLKPSGYFHTVESAKRYADWKQGSPYSAGRNPDAPNLYINGKFHSELGVNFGGDSMAIIGTTAYAVGIMAKYADAFGLSPESWSEIFWERGAYEDLMNNIKNLLYE